MSALTRKLIDIVLNTPNVPRWDGSVLHYVDAPDRIEIEKRVDEWIDEKNEIGVLTTGSSLDPSNDADHDTIEQTWDALRGARG